MNLEVYRQSTMPKTRTRCVYSVVRGQHICMDMWDTAFGYKFNAEIETSNQHDRYAVNDGYAVTDRYVVKDRDLLLSQHLMTPTT